MATVQNTYRLTQDISSIYNIYKDRSAQGSDFLEKINSLLSAETYKNLRGVISKAQSKQTIGDLINLNGLNLNYVTQAPEGNYISNVFGTSEVTPTVEPIKDRLTILGGQDNSLQAFLSGSASTGATSGGASGGGGGSGGGGSGGLASGLSGGGSSGGTPSSILAAALQSAQNTTTTSSGTTPTNPTVPTSPVSDNPASQTDLLMSAMAKRLRQVSKGNEIRGLLTNTNLRQQTLLGR